MENLLSSLSKVSETSINSNIIKNILEKTDIKNINYKDYISGYDLSKYNKIVIKSKPLKIFLVTWPSQSILPIHQHNKYWGYIAVLKGLISESLYSYDDNDKVLSIHPSRSMKRGEIIYEPLNIIHQLTNPSPLDVSISLHLYYPPNYDYEGTMMFDAENKKLAELTKDAPCVSWNHPDKFYKRLEENAFEVAKLW